MPIAGTPDLPKDLHSPNYSSDLLPPICTRSSNTPIRSTLQLLPSDPTIYTSLSVPLYLVVEPRIFDVPIVELPLTTNKTAQSSTGGLLYETIGPVDTFSQQIRDGHGPGKKLLNKKKEMITCQNCDTFFTRHTRLISNQAVCHLCEYANDTDLDGRFLSTLPPCYIHKEENKPNSSDRLLILSLDTTFPSFYRASLQVLDTVVDSIENYDSLMVIVAHRGTLLSPYFYSETSKEGNYNHELNRTNELNQSMASLELNKESLELNKSVANNDLTKAVTSPELNKSVASSELNKESPELNSQSPELTKAVPSKSTSGENTDRESTGQTWSIRERVYGNEGIQIGREVFIDTRMFDKRMLMNHLSGYITTDIPQSKPNMTGLCLNIVQTVSEQVHFTRTIHFTPHCLSNSVLSDVSDRLNENCVQFNLVLLDRGVECTMEKLVRETNGRMYRMPCDFMESTKGATVNQPITPVINQPGKLVNKPGKVHQPGLTPVVNQPGRATNVDNKSELNQSGSSAQVSSKHVSTVPFNTAPFSSRGSISSKQFSTAPISSISSKQISTNPIKSKQFNTAKFSSKQFCESIADDLLRHQPIMSHLAVSLRCSDNLRRENVYFNTVNQMGTQNEMVCMALSDTLAYSAYVEQSTEVRSYVQIVIKYRLITEKEECAVYYLVLNKAFGCSSSYTSLFNNISYDTLFSFYVKDKIFYSTSYTSIRSQMCRIFKYYRVHSSAKQDQLVLPDSIKNLPVLVQSIAKRDTAKTDWMRMAPVRSVIRWYYPKMFSLTEAFKYIDRLIAEYITSVAGEKCSDRRHSDGRNHSSGTDSSGRNHSSGIDTYGHHKTGLNNSGHNHSGTVSVYESAVTPTGYDSTSNAGTPTGYDSTNHLSTPLQHKHDQLLEFVSDIRNIDRICNSSTFLLADYEDIPGIRLKYDMVKEDGYVIEDGRNIFFYLINISNTGDTDTLDLFIQEFLVDELFRVRLLIELINSAYDSKLCTSFIRSQNELMKMMVEDQLGEIPNFDEFLKNMHYEIR